MHSSRFLKVNIEPILEEWKSFARTMLPPASTLPRTSCCGSHRRWRRPNLMQLGAEHRALRAAVLRLRRVGIESVDVDLLEQVMRFDEGIGQGTAENIADIGAMKRETRCREPQRAPDT